MNCIKIGVPEFLAHENSLLDQFSRTFFDMRTMSRRLIKLVLQRNDINFFQIKAIIYEISFWNFKIVDFKLNLWNLTLNFWNFKISKITSKEYHQLWIENSWKLCLINRSRSQWYSHNNVIRIWPKLRWKRYSLTSV